MKLILQVKPLSFQDKVLLLATHYYQRKNLINLIFVVKWKFKYE